MVPPLPMKKVDFWGGVPYIYIYSLYIRILYINICVYIYTDIVKYIDSPKMKFGVSSFFHETQPVF